MLIPLGSLAQSYPSPTYNNLTVQGVFTATGKVTTTDLATQAANTILANTSGSTASPAAVSVAGCSTSSSALNWTSGTGPGCNAAINAATLGGATFASPGNIGSGAPGSGAFTGLSASGTVSGTGFSNYLASPPCIGCAAAGSGAFTSLSASANNPALNYLDSLTGAVARTYQSKFSDWQSVRDFGATGNGSTNDAASILAAASAANVIVPPGVYLIGTSITLTGRVTIMPGAVFNVSSGITVAFNGGVTAPREQVFEGSGTVTINADDTPDGYPEWWGATVNNSGVDNSVYINDCIVAVTVCRLSSGIYYTSNPVLQQTPGRAVIGASQGPFFASGSSFIENQTASGTIWQIGPNTYTGTLQNTNILKYVALARTGGPTIGAQANGLLIQYTIWTTVEGVLSQDSGVGFHIKGTGQTHLFRNVALRTLAGTGSGTDQFYGYWVDGNMNIGFAGGNASLYMTENAASSTVTWTSSLDYQGAVLSGTYGYSDVFLVNFETANLGYGVNLQGNSSTSTTADIQNEDVRIYDLISDGSGSAGILIANTSLYGSIQIIGGYIDFNSSASIPIGIEYTSSNGSVIVNNMEVMCVGSTTAEAVVATSSRGIVSTNNNYFECKNIPVTLSGVTHSRFEDQVRAFSLGSTSQPVVYIHSSCSRDVLRMMVEGASSAYSQGYYLGDSTTSYSEFNASGLDQAAISASKLNNNGTGVTAVGTFGTSNYATGVMN